MTALEIRELRNKLELTCEKFAAKLGVTGNTVVRWESGENKPSPLAMSALLRMARLERRNHEDK